MISIRELFRYIFFIFLERTFFRSRNFHEKTVVLVKLGGIGDYILFRNFIEAVYCSKKYQGYKIILIGNVEWRDLSVNLDSHLITTFHFLDRNKFLNQPIYRRYFLHKVGQGKFEVLINPTISREFYFDDWISKFIYAKSKISSSGNLVCQLGWQKKISDNWYSCLIPYKKSILFEFRKNLDFFETVLSQPLKLHSPSVNNLACKKLPAVFDSDLYKKPYAVIFIGASGRERKWPIKYWLEVSEYLYKQYKLNVLICGGPGEISDISSIDISKLKYIYDCINKISLIEFSAIISNAKMLISTESCAPHIGVSVDAKLIITITNGNHYGRFSPYPKEIYPRNLVVSHPQINKSNANINQLFEEYYFGSKLNMADILPSSVIAMIDKAFSS